MLHGLLGIILALLLRIPLFSPLCSVRLGNEARTLSSLCMELVESPFLVQTNQPNQIHVQKTIYLIKMFGMEDSGMIYLNYRGC